MSRVLEALDRVVGALGTHRLPQIRADAAVLRELADALSNPTDLALDCARYGYAVSAPNGDCPCCPCSLARLLVEEDDYPLDRGDA